MTYNKGTPSEKQGFYTSGRVGGKKKKKKRLSPKNSTLFVFVCEHNPAKLQQLRRRSHENNKHACIYIYMQVSVSVCLYTCVQR